MEATTTIDIAMEPVFDAVPPAPATMRKVALYYAGMGWHVFPLHTVKDGRCSCGVVDCDHAGKHPRTKHGLSDATADVRIVGRWWEQWPDANIGFHPGPSGIVVLDLDSYKANYAGVELTFVEKQTVTGITGGGGEHLFFSSGGVAYRSRNRAVDGVDIKAWGGYVILAPSLHRSGQRYVWEVGYAPWEYGLAPVPEMVKAILSSEREVKVKAGANGHAVDAGREFERAREALGRLRAGRADDYDDWLKVGMALAELGDRGFDLWDEWSQQSGKYKEGVTAAKWPTFKPGQGVTLATLHHWASVDSPIVVSKNGAKAEEGPTEEAPAQGMTPEEREVLDYLGKNEMGDAEMLAAMYKGKVVYDHAESAWHVWNEHNWQRDDKGQVNNIPTQVLSVTYMDTAAAMAKAANENEATLKRVKELYKRAFLLRTRARRSNVLDLASSHPDLAVAGSEWDAHPWLLAVKNGVVDLEHGTFRPGQPADYMRIVAPVEWKGIDAPAPRWEQFLTEVFDGNEELIAFLQRLFGYSVTGFSTEHVLPILWGKGWNGKDTLLKALVSTLGSGYADTVPEDVFIDVGHTGGANAQPHIYRLRGLRLAWASETEEGARLKGGQVKLVSGGGILTARPLYGSLVSWQATHTVFLITNHRPHGNADDYALWKRLVLIEFTMSFVDEPKDANERKRDANLDAKLQAEAPGILAWLVRGCLAWQKEGLNPPDCVKAATESYRMDEDTLGKWIDENCIVGPLYRFKAGTAYENYAEWCKTSHHHPLNSTNFGRKLTERYPKERTSTGIHYVGIGPLAE